jgi:hypothetical protein
MKYVKPREVILHYRLHFISFHMNPNQISSSISNFYKMHAKNGVYFEFWIPATRQGVQGWNFKPLFTSVRSTSLHGNESKESDWKLHFCVVILQGVTLISSWFSAFKKVSKVYTARQTQDFSWSTALSYYQKYHNAPHGYPHLKNRSLHLARRA